MSASGNAAITGVTADDRRCHVLTIAAPRFGPSNGYEALHAQDGSLDRHAHAYVKDIRRTRADIVITGTSVRQSFQAPAYSSTSIRAGSTCGRAIRGRAGDLCGGLCGAFCERTRVDEDLLPRDRGERRLIAIETGRRVTAKVV